MEPSLVIHLARLDAVVPVVGPLTILVNKSLEELLLAVS
jgi:hypothetical protein